MKKLAWIPVRSFSDFWRSIAGEASYQPQPDAFGTLAGRTQAAVSDETDAVPYQVGAYRFFPDCGLYVLVGCGERHQLDYCAELFTVLGLSGIGGKTSVGYGRFTVEEQIRLDDSDDSQLVFLQHALADASASYQLLLTTSLPRDDELEQTMQHAQYRLIRRSGFIQSNTFNAEPFKKQTQYYLAAGATCTQRYHGDLYTVAESGNHPVYRYSKPMFLGVKA